MSETVEIPSPPYRPKTLIAKTKVLIAFNSGGIGDYIHWIGAIKYAIDSNPHIYGHILSPPYFFDLAKLWLGSYSDRFTVVVGEGAISDSPYAEDAAIIAPDGKQFANACNHHLTRLGFIYYTQKNDVVRGYEAVPEIRGDEVPLTRFPLPMNYVVIPADATAENRRLPASVINSMTKHLISRGVTPVFLGKKDLAPDYKAQSDVGVKTKGCLDLRDQTTLPEAAVIMAKARFTLGMDGGLLHLAACAAPPVAFIFTSVHPDFRVPHRRAGALTTIITPPKELHCRFCNTGEPGKKSMTYIIGHDFKHCLYKDNFCTKIIDAKTLIPVIDELLKETRGT